MSKERNPSAHEFDFLKSEVQTAEYSCYLTTEEKDRLSDLPHTFDLPLSPEDLKFLDENGYLVVKNTNILQ